MSSELKDKPTEYFQLIRSSFEKVKNSLEVLWEIQNTKVFMHHI